MVWGIVKAIVRPDRTYRSRSHAKRHTESVFYGSEVPQRVEEGRRWGEGPDSLPHTAMTHALSLLNGH